MPVSQHNPELPTFIQRETQWERVHAAGCLYACKWFYHTCGTWAALSTVLIVHRIETLPYAIMVRSYKRVSFIKEGG